MILRLRIQALIFVLLLPAGSAIAQEMPHEDINFECEACHSMKGWSGVRFDHADSVGFVLEGRHVDAECRGCHTLKDFSIVNRQCVSCHKDIHEGKLGPDCLKCHTTDEFTIFNIEDIHAETNFPLMGRHALADCQSCHTGLPRGDLSFRSTRCVECHQQQYLEVPSPNHVSAAFSTECDQCHQMNSWRPALLADHDVFFPIFSGEHAGQWDDCTTCHTDPNSFQVFSCFGCHEHNRADTDEDHEGIPGYNYNSQDCLICHPTGEAGSFVDHDALYFPIFTGAHSGQWSACSDCHDNPADRSQFNCLACHQPITTDNLHQSINGYVYLSTACFTCHPDGSRVEFTEHDAAYFPIYSGNHGGVWDECSDCHIDPANRSVFSCLTCHQQAATDNTHTGISAYSYESSACFACHPTGAGGEFAEHDALYFPIYTGTHATVWDDCSDCHIDPDDRSVYSCTVCHTQAETNPIHGGITSYVWESSACFTCHPTGEGGEYTEHDVAYFPIYSGTHDGTWADCTTCHTNPADRSEYTCLVCHDQGTIDPIHQGMTSYSYESIACFTCHPQGEADDYIEHDADFFPIYSSTHNGAWTDCSNCHPNPLNRSEYDCLGCHLQSTVDVIHQGMPSYSYQSTVCFVCHSSGVVEDYVEHDASFFPVYSGEHAGAWADCATCHTDPTDRTVFTCLVCHGQVDMDNMHVGISGYVYNSDNCLSCHPDGTEIEFTEHELSYFPVYSGAHDGVWAECATCHTVPGDRTQFDCLVCHDQTGTDIIHMGMLAEYSYNSSFCYNCHPQGVPEDYPEHDINGFFPIYSGTHLGVWAECSTCHTNPGDRSVFDCLACHDQGTIEPVHLGMISYTYESSSCYSCHPDGIIEPYSEHDTYFFLIYSGTHANKWATCATCHTDPDDRSVFSCITGCHPKTGTDAKHPPGTVPDYVYDSYECHNCHPTGEYP
jgi:hypothetical protein